MDEVTLALRRILSRPGATLASIVTLACAIGASALLLGVALLVSVRPAIRAARVDLGEVLRTE